MYKNMNKNLNNELYHSDVYLGKDFSDGIKHWKYIKREKVNGKWRYYYSDYKLRNKKQDMDSAYEYNKLFQPDEKEGKFDLNAYQRKKVLYELEKEKSDKREKKYTKYINALNKGSDIVYKGKQATSKLLNKFKKKK